MATPAPAAEYRESVHAEIRERLESVLRRICPPWLAAERDDLVQDAVLKVMEIARRQEAEEAPSTPYLWRTAQSVLIDEIRRRRRRGEVGIDDGSEDGQEPLQPASPHPDPERRARSGELGRELWDCLGRLARPRRLAVTLHLQGYSPAESVPLLGWETKKIYNLVHRGVGDLRDCLRQKGLEP